MPARRSYNEGGPALNPGPSNTEGNTEGTLTKAEITEAIYRRTNHTKAQSAELVEALFELIKHTLESGEDVLISGFGKFSVRKKQERRGRNPQTGEPIMLTPRKVFTFKGAGVLREKINRTR